MLEDEIDRIVDQWNRERPDVDASPTHVLQRITRLSLLQEVSFARVFSRHGLTWGEYLVLAALRRAGPPYRMNPTTLYGSVILSSGGMTKRLDRLERAGLVERLPDPDDRRGRLVGLTDHGHVVVDAALLDHLENEQRLLGALAPAERDQLAGLLRKLLLSPPLRELDPAAPDREANRSGRSSERSSHVSELASERSTPRQSRDEGPERPGTGRDA